MPIKHAQRIIHRPAFAATATLSARNKARGFTLLEALLGFLILSIGMLGIASLQGTSLKVGKSSVYNSVAVMKVEEMLESIRANPTPAALTAYAAATDGTNNNCATKADGCTKEELAAEDVFWWKRNLTAGLPNTVVLGQPTTTGAITIIPPTPPSMMATVTVSVNWSERDKDTAAPDVKTYVVTADICTNGAGTPC